MNLARLLCLALAPLLPVNAAENTILSRRAKEAAATLPRGCIATAEVTGGRAPVFTLNGHHEPPGVPPEKILFEIGSISKVFTGLLLAQAVVEKKVTLDTTLREVMGTSQTFVDANVAGITLLQLATHTSGLPPLPDNGISDDSMTDPYARYDRGDLDAFLAKARLDHAPPFASSYSNLGFGLLGDLLSRLYGKTWEQLVLDRIARPLGMIDTCVTLNDEQTRRLAPPYAGEQRVSHWHFKAMAGAGALCSTLTDMLRLGQALAQPYKTPLKESIELAQQYREIEGMGLGLLIIRQGNQTTYWHNGCTGGFSSWLSVNPESAHVVVIFINNSVLLPEEVLSGSAGKKATAPAMPGDPALAEYIGEYDTGVKGPRSTILYRFEARGSELWMQITGQPAIPLERHPTTADRFVFKPVKAEIQFTRKDGKIVSTTLFQAGLEIKAPRLSKAGKPE